MATASRQILREARLLHDGPKLPDRRAAGTKLRSLLTDRELRTRLEREAEAGSQGKRVALTKLWDLVLSAALQAAHRVVSGKIKASVIDITMPYDLLKTCGDLENLTPSIVLKLLEYCLRMLVDEQAMEVAKDKLVEMLYYMCSKRDLVCHFHPDNHLDSILAELHDLLVEDAEHALATRAFVALLETCEELGIGMELVFPQCMDMIRSSCSGWLKSQETRSSAISMNLKHMLTAATTLLAGYPELAVGWVSKRGKPIFAVARRGLASGDIEVIRYFLAHLMVCQTAGRLSGKAPGDLGSLGDHASLNKDSIRGILEVELSRLATKFNNDPEHTHIPRPKGKRKAKAVDAAVVKSEQHSLELCARLLAALQRLYLVEKEWESANEAARREWLLSRIPAVGADPTEGGMETPLPSPLKCSTKAIIESPWYEFVAKPLHFDGGSVSTDVDANGNRHISGDVEMNSPLERDELWEIQESMSCSQASDGGTDNQIPTNPILLLKIICACGELFPLGECWSSSAGENWHSIKSADPILEDTLRCKGCSSKDMALVVHLVTSILESCGGPQGHHETQYWALLCLVRLTETSALVTWGNTRLHELSNALPHAWCRVWSVVFRPDLRYVSYTEGRASAESLGELILILLTEIVRQGCTEMTASSAGHANDFPRAGFLISQQRLVWQLPVFKNADRIKSSAAFELIEVILRRVGLTESGNDEIDRGKPQVEPSVSSSLDDSLKTKRRLRLLSLCLRTIEGTVEFCECPTRRAMAPAVAACAATLVTGNTVLLSTTFESDGSIDPIWHSDLEGCCIQTEPRRFHVTCFQQVPARSLEKYGHETECTYFQSLWDFSALAEFNRYNVSSRCAPLSATNAVDFARCAVRELANIVRQAGHEDFVSRSESSSLRRFAMSCLERVFTDEGESMDLLSMPLARFTFTAKLGVTIAASHCAEELVADGDNMLLEPVLLQVLDRFVSRLASQPEDCSSLAATDVVQLIYALRAMLASACHSVITDAVRGKLCLLFEECHRQLSIFAEASLAESMGVSGSPESRLSCGIERDEAMDFKTNRASAQSSNCSDSDYEYSSESRKRQRSVSSSSTCEAKRKRINDQSESFSLELDGRRSPSRVLACRLASIAVVLRPSIEVYKSVVGRLVYRRTQERHCSEESDNDTPNIDLECAVHSINLLISEALMLFRDEEDPEVTIYKGVNANASNTSSQVGMICATLIKHIRSAAGPGSRLYLFGFEPCSDLTRLRVRSTCEKKIVGIFALDSSTNKLARRNLMHRWKLGVAQLVASTKSYRYGTDRFRKTFFQTFSQKIVFPAIRHVSARVRDASRPACGALVYFSRRAGLDLDSPNLYQQIEGRLAPMSDEDGFRRWCRGHDRHGNADSEDYYRGLWTMERPSMEFISMQCRALIDCVSTPGLHHHFLFDLVQYAGARPEIEAACFAICEKVSELIGFKSAADIIFSESEFLLSSWLQSGKHIREATLVHCAPSLLNELLYRGRHERMPLLREEAARRYLRKNSHFLIPTLLAHSCEAAASPDGEESLAARDAHKRMHETMKDARSIICNCNHREVRTEDLEMLAIDSAHDIRAYFEPLKYGESEPLQRIASLVTSFLAKALAGTDENWLSEGTDHVIRRVLQLWGTVEHRPGGQTITKSCVTKAIQVLQGERDGTIPDEFRFVGGIAANFLLRAKYWLHHTDTPQQIDRRWCVFQWVVKTVVNECRGDLADKASSVGTDMSLCVQALLDILMYKHLEAVQNRALKLLLPVVEMCLRGMVSSPGFKEEFMSVLPSLVWSILLVHRRQQVSIASEIFTASCQQDARARCVFGLSPHADSLGAWGWENDARARTRSEIIQEALASSVIDDGRYDILRSSYGILATLMKSLPKLMSKTVSPLSVSELVLDRVVTDALFRRDPEFCAQTLFRGLSDSKPQVEDDTAQAKELRLKSFLRFSTTIRRTNFSRSFSPNDDGVSASRTPAETHIFINELRSLRKALAQNHRDDCPVNGSVLIKVATELLCFVGSEYPHEVRLEASRCLGSIGPENIEKLSPFAVEDSPSDLALTSDALGALDYVKASCLELMSDCLFAPQAGVALVSLETLKIILSDGGTADYVKCVSNPMRRNLLRALQTSLLAGHSTTIMRFHDIYVNDHPRKCWDKELWACASDERYSEWICDLVSALIKSCYDSNIDLRGSKGSSKHVQSSCSFFRHCLPLCKQDSEFASRVFPGLVLDLLLRDAAGSSSTARKVYTPVQHGTWVGNPDSPINEALSSCFTHLLTTCIGHREGFRSRRDQSAARKPISLAVNTLDMLRKISQQHFLNSKMHKRNSSAAPGRTYANPNFPERKTSHCSAAEYNKKSLPEVPSWAGIPYGIILRIDGMLILEACISSDKYASALFYSEMYYEKPGKSSLKSIEHTFGISFLDISGFPPNDTDSSNGRRDGSEFLDRLESCHLGLCDFDNAEAVRNEKAALRFLDESFHRTTEDLARSSGLEGLRLFDAHLTSQKSSIEADLMVMDKLERLGLKNLLRAYVDGVEARYQRKSTAKSLSPAESQAFCESYYRASLTDLQWGSVPILTGSSVLESFRPIAPTTGEKPGFYESLASAVSSYLRDDSDTLVRAGSQARTAIMNEVRIATRGEFSLAGVVDCVERMQALNEVEYLEKVDSLHGFLSILGEEMERGSIDSLVELSGVCAARGTFREFSSCVREILLRSLHRESPERTESAKLLCQHLTLVISESCMLRRPDLATLSIVRLHDFLRTNRGGRLDMSDLLEIRLYEALVLESSGKFGEAIRYARQVCDCLSSSDSIESQSLRVHALLHCGVWTAQRKVESPADVRDKYLLPAGRMAEALNNPMTTISSKRLTSAHLCTARLASTVYHSTRELVNEVAWAESGQNIERRQQHLKSLGPQLKNRTEKFNMLHLKQHKAEKAGETKDSHALIADLEQAKAKLGSIRTFISREGRDIERLRNERAREEQAASDWRLLALTSLCGALCVAGHRARLDLSQHAFQLISIWFREEPSTDVNGRAVSGLMRKQLPHIPTYFFIPLANQLFSRMGVNKDKDFNEILEELVTRMCKDHPYHCIGKLIALQNGRCASKSACARSILHNLVGIQQKLVMSYKTLFDGYIALADLPRAFIQLPPSFSKLAEKPKHEEAEQVRRAKDAANLRKLMRGRKMKAHPSPCVLTKPPTIVHNANYGELGKDNPDGSELIQEFVNHFSISVGGVSKPRIITCVGKRGGKYEQLVKGNDDLRQDMIVMQVFQYVNNLLKQTKSGSGSISTAARDHLRIRTFACLPLTPTTGVLEFVENSTTLGGFLVNGRKGTVPAHSRYYPGEWGQDLCRAHFECSPQDLQRETYDLICHKFSPCFRYFFTEKFPQSTQTWYRARMRYVRSSAVACMVSHVLGIGDRHLENILVDEMSGEVVHIDFGIVFDQGKLQKKSETVPFRLTRDVVDGMGPCGTDGVFTRSCETTLRVLRDNKDVLRSILEAVVDDPLFQFYLTPEELRRRREQPPDNVVNEEDEETEHEESGSVVHPEAARAGERALEKVLQKLSGHEDGSPESHSVEGQVKMLIEAAKDPNNLCMLYGGWSPWV